MAITLLLSSDINDQGLVDRLIDRDESALTELTLVYQSLLRGVIHQVTHNAAEGEDVFQEVLLQVWNRISTYRAAKGKFSNWLSTLARRRAIDHVRKCCAYQRASERFELANRQEFPGRISGDSAPEAAIDVRRFLDGHLDRLPDRQKEVICLTYLKGLSQREIAVITATALGTVKTRLELGMKKLARALGDSRAKIL